MAANMLGADLDGLTALSQRLDAMSVAVDERQNEAAAIATDVVAELDAAIVRATTRINDGVAALEGEIASSQSQTDSTNWTGGNRLTFEGNQVDFSASLTTTLNEVKNAYTSFDVGLKLLSGQIEDLRGAFTANLLSAAETTDAMSRSVMDQRDVLDRAMNSIV